MYIQGNFWLGNITIPISQKNNISLNKKKKTAKLDDYSENDIDPHVKQHHAIFWLICIETYKKYRKIYLGNNNEWNLVLSEEETVAYINNYSRKIIFGFRGTKIAKDIYDDIQLSLGRIFPRGKAAIDIIKEAQSKYHELEIAVTGHSLGGAIARVAGSEFDLETVTFNAAAPPSSPVKAHWKEVDYHIVYDIISAWQSPNTIRIHKGYDPTVSSLLSFSFQWSIYLKDMIEAHELKNFSKYDKGIILSSKQETSMFNKWYYSLPNTIKWYIWMFLFGTNYNMTGLPNI